MENFVLPRLFYRLPLKIDLLISGILCTWLIIMLFLGNPVVLKLLIIMTLQASLSEELEDHSKNGKEDQIPTSPILDIYECKVSRASKPNHRASLLP